MITDMNRFDDHHKRVLTQLAERNATIAQLAQPQFDSPKLRAELNTYKDRINVLRFNMANYLTGLDIALDKRRLFNCNHDRFCDIPDGHNSTYEVSVLAIANRFFEDWVNDEQFIKDYNHIRRNILQHHKAHEKAQQGKGVASWRIRKEFEAIDQKRGIAIKY